MDYREAERMNCKPGKGSMDGDQLDASNPDLPEIRDALVNGHTWKKQFPELSDVYVVLDESGAPVYVAAWPEACHEHINEALDMDLEFAAMWVVRRFTPTEPA
jgi:hypothetical protein